MNKVLLLGRIVRDPELKYTNEKNIPFLKFILAVERDFKNNNGDRDADFVQIALWGKRAENLVAYLNKGRLINVIGRLNTGSFENSDGQKRYFAEVIGEQINFLDYKKEEVV